MGHSVWNSVLGIGVGVAKPGVGVAKPGRGVAKSEDC